jgi:hypothetical protein
LILLGFPSEQSQTQQTVLHVVLHKSCVACSSQCCGISGELSSSAPVGAVLQFPDRILGKSGIIGQVMFIEDAAHIAERLPE